MIIHITVRTKRKLLSSDHLNKKKDNSPYKKHKKNTKDIHSAYKENIWLDTSLAHTQKYILFTYFKNVYYSMIFQYVSKCVWCVGENKWNR